MTKSITCLILILSAQVAFAWPPTYGAEFVLTNAKMLASTQFKENPNQSPERQGQLDLVAHLRTKCATAGCSIREESGKYGTDFILQFNDGFWIRYSYDPAVVEIMFKPSTLEEIKANQARIDEYVFAAGKELGMYAPREMGGHVNMGVNSMFGKNVESFLKFYVDYANHPDLTLGTLGKNLPNAPTLSVLKAEQRSALKKIVDDFYKGKVPTLKIATLRIQSEVYTSSFKPEWGGEGHYQAVGLKYVNQTDLDEKDAPMELRGIRAQRSTEDFIKTTELMEKRVEYLNKNVSKIIYSETKTRDFTPAQLKTRFKMYVEETGLKFSDYESLLSETIIKSKLSPIADKNAKPAEKLTDLIGYFDLLSSSTYVRDQFIEVLSDPSMQINPRALAYQQYFEKMAKKDSTVTLSPPQISWLTRVLIFLGLSKSESMEHVNAHGTKELYQNLHESIEFKKSLNSSSNILKAYRNEKGKKVLSCEILFM